MTSPIMLRVDLSPQVRAGARYSLVTSCNTLLFGNKTRFSAEKRGFLLNITNTFGRSFNNFLHKSVVQCKRLPVNSASAIDRMTHDKCVSRAPCVRGFFTEAGARSYQLRARPFSVESGHGSQGTLGRVA